MCRGLCLDYTTELSQSFICAGISYSSIFTLVSTHEVNSVQHTYIFILHILRLYFKVTIFLLESFGQGYPEVSFNEEIILKNAGILQMHLKMILQYQIAL